MNADTQALKEQREFLQDDLPAFHDHVLRPLFEDGELDALVNLIAYPMKQDQTLDHAMRLRDMVRRKLESVARDFVDGTKRNPSGLPRAA